MFTEDILIRFMERMEPCQQQPCVAICFCIYFLNIKNIMKVTQTPPEFVPSEEVEGVKSSSFE
jgi:hypothetical protein